MKLKLKREREKGEVRVFKKGDDGRFEIWKKRKGFDFDVIVLVGFLEEGKGIFFSNAKINPAMAIRFLQFFHSSLCFVYF